MLVIGYSCWASAHRYSVFVPQVKGRKRSISHEYGERGTICTCWARPAVDQPAILLGLHYDVIKHLSLDD